MNYNTTTLYAILVMAILVIAATVAFVIVFFCNLFRALGALINILSYLKLRRRS